MLDVQAIAAFLQRRLDQANLVEVPAVQAAAWLNDSGLLKDSSGRPGLPLRNLLRAGKIPQGQQRPSSRSGKWFIVREGPRTAVSPADSDGVGSTSRPSMLAEPEDVAVGSGAQPDGGRTDLLTRAGMTARGFVGFERFKGIALDRVPSKPGVYVVLREKDSRPAFLDRSPAGWFKGQNPTVPVAELEESWPDGAHCVYIGKAGSGNSGGRGLRERLKEFRNYGDGRPVGHQGGRRIWQLADADQYVLAWLPTPGRDPEVIEAELIRAFVAVHGRRPIGNRTSGRLS
jgi:hypothetical protein